jgi:hypothetical protein
VYGREQALKVIRATQTDYKNKYGDQMQQFEAQLLDTISEIAVENAKKVVGQTGADDKSSKSTKKDDTK